MIKQRGKSPGPVGLTSLRLTMTTFKSMDFHSAINLLKIMSPNQETKKCDAKEDINNQPAS